MENIVLRGKTFHYVRRVPRELQSSIGLKFWKRTLKTGNLRAAEVKARVLGVEIDELIKTHRGASQAAKLAAAAHGAQRNYYNAILAQEHAARRGDYNCKFARLLTSVHANWKSQRGRWLLLRRKQYPARKGCLGYSKTSISNA